MFKFDLKPVETPPFEIGDKPYVLREPGTDAAARYRNAKQAAQLKDGKAGEEGELMDVREWAEKKRFAGLNEADAVLVAGCLFENNGQGPVPVTEAFVRDLPDHVSHPLYRWCAHFYNRAQEQAKNFLSATGITS